jgi:hypothetical protein
MRHRWRGDPVSRDPDGGSPRDEPDRERVREGVRRGILDALGQEIDRSSARIVAKLAASGALGVAGAVGSVALFSGNLLRNGHGWRLAVCAAAWAGLLAACFAVALLRIRTQRMPLDRACALAQLGLGLGAILGLACPDPHHLAWWRSTHIGDLVVVHAGLGAAAFCLGASSALLVGAAATAILALRGARFRRAALPGTLLFLILWPAVVLQSAEAPALVFAWWSAGIFAGSRAGVALGLRARRIQGRVA